MFAVKKARGGKRLILAVALVTVVIVAIGGYLLVNDGYASVQGIYIKMSDWTRCYSDSPSPHLNVTTNAIFLSSTHPSTLDTVIRSAKFTLTIDSLILGFFQLPYDTYFSSDHDSLPWLRYTVFNSTLARTVVQTNSSIVSLTMNAVAETLFYQRAVETSDSANITWKPSVLTDSPGCQYGHSS